MSTSPLTEIEKPRLISSRSAMWSLVAALVTPSAIGLVMYRVATTQIGLVPDDGWGTTLAMRLGLQTGTLSVLVTAAAALISLSVIIPLQFGGFISSAREDGRFDDIRLTRIGESGFIRSAIYLSLLRLLVLVAAMAPLLTLATLHSPISWPVLLWSVVGLLVGGTIICCLTIVCSAFASTSRSGITRSLTAIFVVVWLPIAALVSWRLVRYIRDPLLNNSHLNTFVQQLAIASSLVAVTALIALLLTYRRIHLLR